MHHDREGSGNGGGGDRLQDGSPESDAVFNRRPKNGGPPVESQVQGVQGGGRQERLAPADGAGGYSEGSAEMAGQAGAGLGAEILKEIGSHVPLAGYSAGYQWWC
jgi:hypothetical protein